MKNNNKFYKKIEDEAIKLQIYLKQEQIESFNNYKKLLLEWNEKINLTAITEENEITIKHFIDSITINKYINQEDKIIDVGTGAGMPGIPIKILNPKNKIVLMDSLNKRIKFLQEIIKKLKLKNIEAIHSRAEELGRNKNHREKYDVVVSRAVAPMNILVEYMMPFAKVGGKCICMKGNNFKKELEESKIAINLLGGEIEKVEESYLIDTEIKRTIIVIKKTRNTTFEYPRKAGTPSKEPIKEEGSTRN